MFLSDHKTPPSLPLPSPGGGVGGGVILLKPVTLMQGTVTGSVGISFGASLLFGGGISKKAWKAGALAWHGSAFERMSRQGQQSS